MKTITHKTISITSAVVLSVAALTCDGKTADAKTVVKPTDCRPSTPAATQKIARSWVTLKTTLDQSRYSVGQPIAVRLTATNTHTSGAYLRFTSGQRFDFSIYPLGKKDAVYTWSASRMFMQALGSLWIKLGQSEEFVENIGDEMGQLKAGKYQLFARLTNSPNNILAAPILFEVRDLGILVTTTTDKTSYKIGEPVEINLTATNHKINLDSKTNDNNLVFSSGQMFDVVITDEAENQVWNYGANLRFAQNVHLEIWKKGETKKYSTTWNGISLGNSPKLAPGRYRVQGVLQSTPNVYAAPVFIDITE